MSTERDKDMGETEPTTEIEISSSDDEEEVEKNEIEKEDEVDKEDDEVFPPIELQGGDTFTSIDFDPESITGLLTQMLESINKPIDSSLSPEESKKKQQESISNGLIGFISKATKMDADEEAKMKGILQHTFDLVDKKGVDKVFEDLVGSEDQDFMKKGADLMKQIVSGISGGVTTDTHTFPSEISETVMTILDENKGVITSNRLENVISGKRFVYKIEPSGSQSVESLNFKQIETTEEYMSTVSQEEATVLKSFDFQKHTMILMENKYYLIKDF